MSIKLRKRTSQNARLDRLRPGLLIEDLANDAGSTRTRLSDVKDKRAADRMRVRGHDPPSDGVCARTEIRRQANGHRGRVWSYRSCVVNPAGSTVYDTNGAESRFDGFAEGEHDLLRSTAKHLVVRRRRRIEPGVRQRRRRNDERCN